MPQSRCCLGDWEKPRKSSVAGVPTEIRTEHIPYTNVGRYCQIRPCRSSASHRGGPSSCPGQVGFVVDEVALGQVFSEYFGFPRHTHLSSGAGTVGQSVADVPSGLTLTRPQETEIKKLLLDQLARFCYSLGASYLICLLTRVTTAMKYWISDIHWSCYSGTSEPQTDLQYHRK
jgi:hypothetical protein